MRQELEAVMKQGEAAQRCISMINKVQFTSLTMTKL